MNARIRGAIEIVSWAVLLSIVAAWGLMYRWGDQRWLGTVLLFGPRELLAWPLLALAPWAAFQRGPRRWVFLAAALLLPWPIFGVSIGGLFTSPRAADSRTIRDRHEADPSRIPIRILSCNVQGDHVRSAAFAGLLLEYQPDVVFLQEANDDAKQLVPAGWHLRQAGQLVVASRHAIDDWAYLPREKDAPPSSADRPVALYCQLRWPSGRSLSLVTVHLHTPRAGLEIVLDRDTLIDPRRSGLTQTEIDYRWAEAGRVHAWAQQHAAQAIAGDFNMPVESQIYRQVWGTYRNAFRSAGLGIGHTKWTSLGPMNFGIRIDHLLLNGDWDCYRFSVAPPVGSDHRPIVVDIGPRHPPGA